MVLTLLSFSPNFSLSPLAEKLNRIRIESKKIAVNVSIGHAVSIAIPHHEVSSRLPLACIVVTYAT